MNEIANDEKNLFLFRPHLGEIIAIFRMLGIGYQENEGLFNNFVQVPTGEGKSLILAFVSIIFSLHNYEVYCACYSELLSNRDKLTFSPLFEKLSLVDRIHYGTFNDLCELVINERGDIREKV
jgi:hypothetical protein